RHGGHHVEFAFPGGDREEDEHHADPREEESPGPRPLRIAVRDEDPAPRGPRDDRPEETPGHRAGGELDEAPTHARDAPPRRERPSEGGERAPGPRDGRHHTRTLLARAADPPRRGRAEARRATRAGRC